MSTLPRIDAVEPIIDLSNQMVQERLDLDLATGSKTVYVNVYRKPSVENPSQGWYIIGEHVYMSASEAYADAGNHPAEYVDVELEYEGVLPLTARQAQEVGCLVE